MTVASPDVNEDSSGRSRLLLAEHHRELETACCALLGHTYGEDPRELVLQYRAFEDSTLDHLVAEEDLILPAYADHDPDDAAAIRREHGTIRQLLFQIGIEVELHIVRAETVKRLIDVLQTHAAREDASMYRWAQDHLPLSTKRQLFVRIGHALRTLARHRRVSAEPVPAAEDAMLDQPVVRASDPDKT